MPAGVQGQVSWAICHLLFFSLSLRAWLCEQWEQICTCYICKLPKELTWGAMLWLSWLEIYFLIMWNFEKVCGEEAKAGSSKNSPSYLALSQPHLQKECLSFLSELCSNNAWLAVNVSLSLQWQCYQSTASLYWRFLKTLECFVVFCFAVVIFVVVAFSVSSILKFFHGCSAIIRKGKILGPYKTRYKNSNSKKYV